MVNSDISTEEVQAFITRLKNIFDLAKKQYINICQSILLIGKTLERLEFLKLLLKNSRNIHLHVQKKSDLYQTLLIK